MHISVAICTWNRARLLHQTLECMASSLRIPSGVEWELLIVNNNCTDDTDAVIAAFRERLPVRRLFELEQGLANARNLAVREAKGDYIVWTDDDVLVDAEWLEEYCLAFRRWPETSIFGGPVDPWFPFERPIWLQEAWPLVRTAFAVLDLGPEQLPLTMERLPYGANMGFRMDVQRRFPYDPALGHCGHGKIGGEETRVMRAMLASAATGQWIPGARVSHFIPKERQTVAYLREYYVGRGRRLYLEEGGHGGFRRSPAYWSLRALAGEMVFHVGRVLAAPRLWVRGLRAASVAAGFLRAAAEVNVGTALGVPLPSKVLPEMAGIPTPEGAVLSINTREVSR
jgi:glucosyl-dolichyl phosphate glucuronosyltransferase